jgi:hypothetical protein
MKCFIVGSLMEDLGGDGAGRTTIAFAIIWR